MGKVTTAIYDWLGKRIDSDVTEAAGSIADEFEEDIAACKWMELARYVMASYVSSSLQLCEVSFFDKGGRTSGRNDNWIWNVSPNPNQNRADFFGKLLDLLLIETGEAVVVPVRSGSQVCLYVADGYSKEVQPGLADKYSNISIEGSTEVVRGTLTSDQLYVFTLDGVGGGWKSMMDAVSACYDQLTDVILRATADRNGRKWILQMDTPTPGTKEQRDAIKERLQRQVMPYVKASTGVVPLFKGETLTRASLDSGRYSGMNAKDIANIRSDMFALVAACFRIPATMIDGSMNNFESVMNAFLTFAVDPVAEMVGEEITRKTYRPDQWANGSFAQVDTHKIRHVDLFQAADQIRAVRECGIDSANELRSFTGQDPIPEPWADEYVITKNFEATGGGEKNEQADRA